MRQLRRAEPPPPGRPSPSGEPGQHRTTRHDPRKETICGRADQNTDRPGRRCLAAPPPIAARSGRGPAAVVDGRPSAGADASRVASTAHAHGDAVGTRHLLGADGEVHAGRDRSEGGATHPATRESRRTGRPTSPNGHRRCRGEARRATGAQVPPDVVAAGGGRMDGTANATHRPRSPRARRADQRPRRPGPAQVANRRHTAPRWWVRAVPSTRRSAGPAGPGPC